jgi:hypothetical protein
MPDNDNTILKVSQTQDPTVAFQIPSPQFSKFRLSGISIDYASSVAFGQGPAYFGFGNL